MPAKPPYGWQGLTLKRQRCTNSFSCFLKFQACLATFENTVCDFLEVEVRQMNCGLDWLQ